MAFHQPQLITQDALVLLASSSGLTRLIRGVLWRRQLGHRLKQMATQLKNSLSVTAVLQLKLSATMGVHLLHFVAVLRYQQVLADFHAASKVVVLAMTQGQQQSAFEQEAVAEPCEARDWGLQVFLQR